MEPISKHAYRPDIDGLRAIAILLVVFYHAFPTILTGGFIGVDVFFVISGYLITLSILEDIRVDSFSLKLFYGRRFRRIGPALIVMLFTVTILSWIFSLGSDFQQFGKHLVAGATFTSNFLLRRDAGYFDGTAETKPLLHLWSLSIEEQFYLIWPIVLAFLCRNKKTTLKYVFSLFIISFLLNVFMVKGHQTSAFYLLPSRFWELLLGCGLAVYEIYYSKNISTTQNSRFATSKTVFALGLLIVIAGVIDRTSLFPGWWALIPTVSTTLIIAAGPNNWVNKNLLSNRILVGIGLISYPLYLWHWPLLSLARTSTEKALSPTATLGVVLISVVLSYLTYKFFETPVKKFFNFKSTLRFRKPTTVIVATSIPLITLACVGYLIFKDIILTQSNQHNPLALKLEKQAIYDYAAIRIGKCILDTTIPFKGFDPTCYEYDRSAKVLMLIGDSHASHFYPAIEDFFKPLGYSIVQLNASSCSPLMFKDKDHSVACSAANDFVRTQIQKIKPEILVVSSAWTDMLRYPEQFPKDFSRTLDAFLDFGAKHIFIIGPSPEWDRSLPRIMERNYLKNGQGWVNRTSIGLNQEISTVDKKLLPLADVPAVKYISLMKPLCNSDGCMVGDTVSDLMFYDGEHLTQPGARYVIQNIIGPAIKTSIAGTDGPVYRVLR